MYMITRSNLVKVVSVKPILVTMVQGGPHKVEHLKLPILRKFCSQLRIISTLIPYIVRIYRLKTVSQTNAYYFNLLISPLNQCSNLAKTWKIPLKIKDFLIAYHHFCTFLLGKIWSMLFNLGLRHSLVSSCHNVKKYFSKLIFIWEKIVCKKPRQFYWSPLFLCTS